MYEATKNNEMHRKMSNKNDLKQKNQNIVAMEIYIIYNIFLDIIWIIYRFYESWKIYQISDITPQR